MTNSPDSTVNGVNVDSRNMAIEDLQKTKTALEHFAVFLGEMLDTINTDGGMNADQTLALLNNTRRIQVLLQNLDNRNILTCITVLFMDRMQVPDAAPSDDETKEG